MKKFLFMLVALTVAMVSYASTPKSWDTDIGSYVNVTIPTNVNVINIVALPADLGTVEFLNIQSTQGVQFQVTNVSLMETSIETFGHLIKPGFSPMNITYNYNNVHNKAIYKRVRHRQGNMIRAVQPVRNSFMTTA